MGKEEVFVCVCVFSCERLTAANSLTYILHPADIKYSLYIVTTRTHVCVCVCSCASIFIRTQLSLDLEMSSFCLSLSLPQRAVCQLTFRLCHVVVIRLLLLLINLSLLLIQH